MPSDSLKVSEGAAWKVLWTLAWPAVLLNSLQTINSLLDAGFIAHLPPSALTAVGGSTPVIFLFGSLTFMLGTAATAMVARFYGAKDEKSLKDASQKSLGLALYVGILLAAIAIPSIQLFAPIMLPPNSDEAAKAMGVYLGIFALSLPAMSLIQCLAGALRGIGDTKSPMVLSGMQILLHILLNWIFIFDSHNLGFVTLPGFGWGLAGAAGSLTISAWMAALGYLWWAKQTPLRCHLELKPPGLEWTKRILKIAIPTGVLSIVRVAALMAFTSILARVPQGESAVAALRIGFSVESLAFMPAFGLAVAASALVGQSLGMEDSKRAMRLGWLAGHHAAVVSTIVSILLFIFAGPIAHALVPDQPEVAKIAAHYIMYVAATETFFAYAMVLIGGMQGAGDTVTPLILTVVCMWMIRVPLAAWLALPWGWNMGADGCWLALSITQVVQGVLAMAFFAWGRWQKAKV